MEEEEGIDSDGARTVRHDGTVLNSPVCRFRARAGVSASFSQWGRKSLVDHPGVTIGSGSIWH